MTSPTSRAQLLIGVAALGAACGGDAEFEEDVSDPECDPTLDFVPIQQYSGAIASVQEREDAVALIAGRCTGTLVAAGAGPVVLTAGHCVSLGDRAVVAFNVEQQPDGDPLVTEGTVTEREMAPDYALIQIDALPNTSPTLLTTLPSDLLAVIQHPLGRPKVVAEGNFVGASSGHIYYSVGTQVGSSGAGVLNHRGHLVAVHTDGDCVLDDRGSTAAAIVATSPYLQDGDIADR